MKAALLLIPILFLTQLSRAEDEQYTIVECGSDTAVLFEGNRSPDGHYAIGWTIRPVAKDAKPVDWSKFEKEGAGYFRDDEYLFEDGYYRGSVFVDKKQTHRYIDGIVDLRSKSFKPIPVTDPFGLYPGYDRFGVQWVDDQHAIILRNGKWATEDAFFVSPASDPLEVTSLLPKMNELVRDLIREKRPLAPLSHIYFSYRLHENDHKKLPCRIENGVLHARFYSQIPRGSSFDEGHLLISLKNGKALRVTSDSPPEQPFVGELGEADKRLNQVYRELYKLLPNAKRKQLVTDQRKWISDRNYGAYQMSKEHDEGTLESCREPRDQEALKLTRERTAVLQQQLDAIASK